MGDTEPHAVRWYRRVLRGQMREDWTRWHWTENASFTVCGVPIPIGIDGGSFLPETDDDLRVVDCKHCARQVVA